MSIQVNHVQQQPASLDTHLMLQKKAGKAQYSLSIKILFVLFSSTVKISHFVAASELVQQAANVTSHRLTALRGGRR
jgi:hypothetical protein